ncbi:MAG: hypothetical protein V5B44_18210 [Candidatus Accumulibacter necessarius]|jgi:hypothetical protein|uniref:hypothetical protein n=1 Tax=Candidatus Accumulibacter necessarius TaxID=2954386 RepID=UPI002FC3C901
MSTTAGLLEQSRLELREAEHSRDALKRQILGEAPTLLPDASQEPVAGFSIPEIDGRIDTQQRNLDAMLQRYTDKHPDVVTTRRLIKDLEEQKQEEIVARRKATADQPVVVGQCQPRAAAIEGFPLRDRGESRSAADAGGGVSVALRAAEIFDRPWCPRSKPSLHSSIATTTSTRRTTNNWFNGENRRAWGARWKRLPASISA